MKPRRRRPNAFLVLFLLAVIGGLVYFNLMVVPSINPPFVPTPTPTRDPVSYVEEADALSKEGKLLAAIDTYKAAINAAPTNIENYLKLARLQIYSNQLAEAQVNSENAILLDNTRSDALALLAWSKGFQKKYLEAEVDARKAIELDTNNALGHAIYAYLLGLRTEAGLDELDTIDKAIEESRTALALDPNLMEAHWARGYVLEITSNYAEAAAQLEEAIQINPNISDIHIALGRNYMTLGELDQAVFEFTKAYSLNPTNPTPNLFISRVYGMLGEWEKGIQYGELALQNGPTDPNLYANLGTLYYRKGQYSQAIDYLQISVQGGLSKDGEAVPGIPLEYRTSVIEIYSRYGLSLAKVNRCNEAVAVANGMLQTIPDDADGAFNANEVIKICEENLLNPPTATPVPTSTPVTGPTATPAGTSTP